MVEQFFRDNYVILVKRIGARRMQKADAEDVVQEAFLRAIKYQDSFNPELYEIGAWFNTILNNAFKDYRHAAYTGDYSFTDTRETEYLKRGIMEEIDDMEEQWIDQDMIEKIRYEILLLPKGHASIVHLVLLNGYKYKEAAQVMDEKVENIKKVLYRFKQAMRERYCE